MNKKLEEMRDLWEVITAGGQDVADVANVALDFIPELLSLVDTQAERIWGLQVALENADKAIDGVMELKKQIEKGREIMDMFIASWVLCPDCGEEDGGGVIVHYADCKIWAWLKEVAS